MPKPGSRSTACGTSTPAATETGYIGDDIESVSVVRAASSHRILVRNTDNGKVLEGQVNDLKDLTQAYKFGLIKEKI